MLIYQDTFKRNESIERWDITDDGKLSSIWDAPIKNQIKSLKMLKLLKLYHC
jgi:hypothetical protein